jgi:hypothetical protein
MLRNMLGFCGATGDGAGWLNERDGDDGVVGETGDDGRVGAEYERDPRLPPLLARAQASPAWTAITAKTMNPIVATRVRPFMVPSPDL